uniref:Bifunctional epoxide hydrolase 2-like n=1 Tax=Castor canadensis TaxID=51338 RepID=A0A8B7U872_CASCN
MLQWTCSLGAQVVFLDDFESYLKPARDLGMVTIHVQDTNTALKELEKVTGTQLLHPKAPLPITCNPSDLSHGYVTIKPGVHLHFVELGSGPVVCLCHGFPESWFSWRYQIPALAQAGFRVLAMDMKGYGDSSSPPEIEEYAMEVLCKEMVTFLDKLGIPQAVFIGHDWAGVLVWKMAVFYPDRVRAVASLNTPYMPGDPKVHPMEAIKSIPVFNYQLYFQEPVSACWDPAAAGFPPASRPVRSVCRWDAAAQAAMALRVAVFGLGGVLTLPSVADSLSRTEEALALPRGFLHEAFQKEGLNGPTAHLLRGEITFSQWVPLMEDSYKKHFEVAGILLPKNFSVGQIFSKAMSARSINRPMLQAALALRKKGFTTCVLTNNWLDDSVERGSLAQLMCELNQHFDFVIESCQTGMIKPEPQLYKFVLDTVKASPSE